ncbi:hypothetical protein PAXRUDRAFT_22465 [Paxillus rubicundulus Ve08.2h10]|uniref:Unplaced genomic scaffold scaffold_6478, whole genome shotgun sequence n=1 Tax=Paxillus rubicundulus Ve08.2h10 TaxID=930991 RepID=A0A0D0CXG1_9AGAM|nr:hypothetical protein PAXRUDRAFT_22465 [Paxillus rubicundulus Ve08.2h10]
MDIPSHWQLHMSDIIAEFWKPLVSPPNQLRHFLIPPFHYQRSAKLIGLYGPWQQLIKIRGPFRSTSDVWERPWGRMRPVPKKRGRRH